MGLGMVSVNGRNRVPNPPTRISAFILLSLLVSSWFVGLKKIATSKKPDVILITSKNYGFVCFFDLIFDFLSDFFLVNKEEGRKEDGFHRRSNRTRKVPHRAIFSAHQGGREANPSDDLLPQQQEIDRPSEDL